MSHQSDPAAHNEAVIRTESLSKTFRSFRKPDTLAVHNVNLAVQPRQVYGFLGPNGAGKSTTIRMLLNLVYPSSGRVFIFGQDPHDNPAVLRRVGALVEGATFYPYLSAWDNLKVIGHSLGDFDDKRAQELLDFVNLAGKEKVKVSKFSTGMKQRLGIAAALLHDPELLILDEPTNGMDPVGIQGMRNVIRNLAEEQGKTVFMSSHILDEVQQTCHRVAIIHQGQIKAEAAVNELMQEGMWIQFQVGDAQTARSILNGYETEVKDTDSLLVQIKREQTPQVIQQLVAADVEIFQVAPYQRSLEEFFFEVVGADLSGKEVRLS